MLNRYIFMKILIILIFLISLAFCQVQDSAKLTKILDETKVSDFPYPGDFEKDLIELLPDSMQVTLKKMLFKDSIPEDPEMAWDKGLKDAMDDLSENSPTIYGYGLGTIILRDSLKEQWSCDKVEAYIYSEKFGIESVEKYGCSILPSQKAYIEGYNNLTFTVLEKYYGFDIKEFTRNNVIEYIIKYGQYHKDWLLN